MTISGQEVIKIISKKSGLISSVSPKCNIHDCIAQYMMIYWPKDLFTNITFELMYPPMKCSINDVIWPGHLRSPEGHLLWPPIACTPTNDCSMCWLCLSLLPAPWGHFIILTNQTLTFTLPRSSSPWQQQQNVRNEKVEYYVLKWI